MPSRAIDCASTVAVVVPSPAMSEVLEATSLTICAPMFSNLSFSSISSATETPSLVTVGAPNERSSTTLRPFGPRVTLTALARMLIPATMRSRAESPNLTSLAAILQNSGIVSISGGWCGGGSGLDHAHDVFLAHHEELIAFDLHGLAGILAEQHLVAHLDSHRTDLAVVEDLAIADGQHFALVGLFTGAVGDHDTAGGLAFGFQTLDDHAIVQGTNLHRVLS